MPHPKADLGAIHPRISADGKHIAFSYQGAIWRAPRTGGTMTRLFQGGLAKLHYAVSRTGVFDDPTARAVMAYRKVNGLARTYSLSEAIVRRVLTAGRVIRRPMPSAGGPAPASVGRQFESGDRELGRDPRQGPPTIPATREAPAGEAISLVGVARTGQGPARPK